MVFVPEWGTSRLSNSLKSGSQEIALAWLPSGLVSLPIFGAILFAKREAPNTIVESHHKAQLRLLSD